jgi:hypothetical protein
MEIRKRPRENHLEAVHIPFGHGCLGHLVAEFTLRTGKKLINALLGW